MDEKDMSTVEMTNTYVFVFFADQTSRFINQSGACFDAIVCIISTSYSQSNASSV